MVPLMAISDIFLGTFTTGWRNFRGCCLKKNPPIVEVCKDFKKYICVKSMRQNLFVYLPVLNTVYQELMQFSIRLISSFYKRKSMHHEKIFCRVRLAMLQEKR
jgi:chemotaxis protein CheY-P-specific phosphatase CheC